MLPDTVMPMSAGLNEFAVEVSVVEPLVMLQVAQLRRLPCAFGPLPAR